MSKRVDTAQFYNISGYFLTYPRINVYQVKDFSVVSVFPRN